jgi:hypothetical protein
MRTVRPNPSVTSCIAGETGGAGAVTCAAISRAQKTKRPTQITKAHVTVLSFESGTNLS